jgi:hypothetical protein
MGKIIFLDFGVYLHRSIFASLHNPKIPSTYTAMSMIISNLKRIGVNPDDRIIIAVDKGRSWRKEVDHSYKANRKEAREKLPIDWKKEYANFKDLLFRLEEATDWNIIAIDGIEADDIMAVGSRYFKDREVILCTFDSDLEQMWAYENVKIFSPIKKYKNGKGAYKIPSKDFNAYKLLSKKIEKEVADNLISPVLSQNDYEKRKTIVNLLELPENIENVIKDRLANLEDKQLNIDLIPFKNIREKFMDIYNSDKIITYKDCLNKKKRKKK